MQSIRTIVVDDEAFIRRGIERLVRSCGEPFEILSGFDNGRDALNYLHEVNGAVDLVITDVKMPEMDGVAFIREARKHYDFFPLFISGYDDFEYVHAAMLHGSVDYFLKPIDRDRFRIRLAEIRKRIAEARESRYRLADMEKKAERLKSARQTQLLKDVMSTEADLSRLGYWVEEFPDGRYVLLNIALDALPAKARHYTDKDWKAYSYALENIIDEITRTAQKAPFAGGWWWRGNADHWVLLHAGRSADPGFVASEAFAAAEQYCRAVRTYTPFTVSVAVSDMVEDLYLLREAGQSTIGLLNYRLVFGGNQVFTSRLVGQTGAYSLDAVDPGCYRTVKRIVQAVQQADDGQAAARLNGFFDELAKLESPRLIQWLLQYLTIQIHAVWMEHAEDIGAADSPEEELNRIKLAAGLGQIKQEVKRLVLRTTDAIRQHRREDAAKPVELAKAWILEHLDEEITIKKVADHVYLNPTYFCKCFKTQTGETVLDYVTRMRMEKAKDILRDRSLNLQDVSRRVGYQDAKYFSRLFKQWHGLSPSQYRERLRLET
ncbi:MAG: DNA-binding response regulator [Paenibacillaceae bacterium]|nr:MAG: DNA-binding response regulator [Paenibacillaceae bacterium]